MQMRGFFLFSIAITALLTTTGCQTPLQKFEYVQPKNVEPASASFSTPKPSRSPIAPPPPPSPASMSSTAFSAITTRTANLANLGR